MQPTRVTGLLLLLIICLASSACSAEPRLVTDSTPSPVIGTLVPYRSPTPSRTATPLPPPTATSTPLPAATQLTHTVIQGEDLFGISLRYGITLAALRAANPEVDPNFLRIGAVLIIPSPDDDFEEVAALPTPPPLELPLSPVHCRQDASAGVWCFLEVSNDTDTRAQGISVEVSLVDSEGYTVVSQTAAAPLDLLQPQETLPVAIYFQPPLPSSFQASARLLTASPVPIEDTRFIDLRVENMLLQERMDGLAIDISGDLVLDGPDEAARVWVLAVAYDDVEIIGLRRWESASTLLPAQPMPFLLRLYSLSGEIKRVEVFTEAHRQ